MPSSKFKNIKLLSALLCLLFFQSKVYAQRADNSKPADTNNSETELSENEDTENLIHPGDLIEVDVVGSTEFDWRGGLTPEGFLSGINFVENPIYALCRTEKAVAADVAKGYAKLLRNPQIEVKILDRSQRPVAFLYGAVKNPQRFQIKRAVNLNELLILSGGLTDKVSGEIQILRSRNLSCAAKKNSKNPNRAKPASDSEFINVKIADLLEGKPAANPQILTGDVVTVLESKPIYVTGGVANPRQLDARSEINITRAIAAAGGLTKDADPKNITIFRVENKQTRTIDVDYEKIKSGQADDLALRAFDIVDVSQKGKTKSRYSLGFKAAEESLKKSQNLPLKIID